MEFIIMLKVNNHDLRADPCAEMSEEDDDVICFYVPMQLSLQNCIDFDCNSNEIRF